MKLLQLNLWGGRLEPQILKIMRDEQPDILCLQEAIDLPGGRGALFVPIESIQEAIGADYTFMSPVFSMNYMGRKASFGNCIISKYPILKSETIFTAKEYIADFDLLKHDANMRNLQIATVKLPDGSELNILNHHGHHDRQHKDGGDETMRQCKIIADKIRSLDGRIIMAGDFNLSPYSESLEQINEVISNLAIEAKLITTRTPLTHKTEVCDYIFANDKIEVESFETLDEVVSDHKALVVNFK